MSIAQPDPNDVAPAGAPRPESRDNIFLSAELMFEGASEPVTARIRNISAGGMMIDCPANFPIGHVVTANLRNIGAVKGRIAWAVKPRMGIAFDVELDPKKVRYAPDMTTAQAVANSYAKIESSVRRPGLGSL